MNPILMPESVLSMALVGEGDEHFPATLDGLSLPLNRVRLAAFLARFADDDDVTDLLSLDLFATAAGLPITSTGLLEPGAELALRPFRLWEYTWLYKALGLAAGGHTVLDLGGPASHVTVLAALAGSSVTSVDLNPDFVQAGRECARALNLQRLEPFVGDMRDLSRFPDDSFDVVISSSVLEHLSAHDQEIALREAARVLKPGGLVGLTFDFGPGAPGANEDLPPPHEPPTDRAEALRRYLQGGLVPVGAPLSEDPIEGSLFHSASIRYTVASLVLAKPPVPDVPVPVCARTGAHVFSLPAIENFPFRIYTSRQASLRLIADLRAQVEVLTAAADERLAVLEKTHEAAAVLRAELENRKGEIASLRSQLNRNHTSQEDSLRLVADLRAQVEVLTAAADERLVALEKAHEAAAVLRAELENRKGEIASLRSQLK